MDYFYKKLSFMLLFSGAVTVLLGQQAIGTSGGNANGAGGSVSYTLGEVVYTTNIATLGSAAQGVQQAYEIFATDIKGGIGDISLSVFPNPTQENLVLEIKEFSSQNLDYQLFDAQGRLVEKGEISTTHTHIRTQDLPSAAYFLSVFQDNQPIISFKIIKN